MKPQIKRIDTNSSDSLEDLFLNRQKEFGFWITVSIGEDQVEGADDFQFFVCSRAWLEGVGSGMQIPDRYLLLDDDCDPAGLKSSLNEFLANCAGATWADVVKNICRVGWWEFDGYK
mgnify:CR=1 FL=1